MRRRRVPLGLLLAAVVAGGAVAVQSATQGSSGGRMAVVGFGPQGVLVDARSRRVYTLDDVGVDRRGTYLRTGAVSVLDAGTGALLRSVPVGNNPTWMAGDERTGRLFVVVLGIGSANGLTVRTLDTTTGAVLHSVTLLRSPTAGGSVWLGPGAIAVDAQTGHVFLINRVSYPPAPTLPRLWVLDGRRGTLVQTLRLPTAASAVVVAPRAHHAFVASASKPAMWMLDAGTGALRRTIPLPGVAGAMAVDGATDEVLVANSLAAGTVSVFDGRTGWRQRSIPSGTYPSALLLDERRGRAFVLDQAVATPTAPGSISTIDLRRGRLLRTVSVGVHPVAMAADERAGRVFILNQETRTRTGTVSVLAATTGLDLKTIAVGYQPSALAVDEPTGHVFVTSQSASVPGHGAFAALIERVQEFMAVTPRSTRGIVSHRLYPLWAAPAPPRHGTQ